MAECSTFSTAGAIRLFTVRSVMMASFALRPRIRSTTRRAFCGDTRMYLASALTSILFLLRFRRLLSRRFRLMAFERAGRGEFAHLVPHHVLGHVNRNELPAVMHGDRVTHELGQNRRAPRPRANHFLLARRVQLIDPLFEVRVGKWSLFYRTSHYCFPLRSFTMNLS